MPGNLRQLRSPPILMYRQILLLELYRSTCCVKTFNPATLSLVTYRWPIQGQERVAPDAWHDHRKSHEFLGPCCLCPLLASVSTEPRFIEAAVYIPILGWYTGEYVAECARSRCGYVVPLERLYSEFGVPVKSFPLREANTACPPLVFHESEMGSRFPWPLKRTYAQLDITNPDPPQDVDLGYRTHWRKFVKLDCMDGPGLTEVEFLGLFVKCDTCELITTCLMFDQHHCRSNVVVDDDLDPTDTE